ncbi:hypothetical protein M8A51_18205 [Schlegelella sp. S2-27]|uniref:Uncharacterized protein n=1 Tax=Caldimonas mangrovi TaxID=2944811 RepID=A0ABT0YRU9_9BURK|nr:hypothetical protein [Caldimonas mangrovi]MCM5681465.1 hypothetical protein [Caldimonas mangrovi]
MATAIRGIDGAGMPGITAPVMRAAPLELSSGTGGAVSAIEQLVNNLVAALQSAAGALNSLPAAGRCTPQNADRCAPLGPSHGADSMRNELQGIMQLLQGLLSTMLQLLNALKAEHGATRLRGACTGEGLQQADG